MIVLKVTLAVPEKHVVNFFGVSHQFENLGLKRIHFLHLPSNLVTNLLRHIPFNT